MTPPSPLPALPRDPSSLRGLGWAIQASGRPSRGRGGGISTEVPTLTGQLRPHAPRPGPAACTPPFPGSGPSPEREGTLSFTCSPVSARRAGAAGIPSVAPRGPRVHGSGEGPSPPCPLSQTEKLLTRAEGNRVQRLTAPVVTGKPQSALSGRGPQRCGVACWNRTEQWTRAGALSHVSVALRKAERGKQTGRPGGLSQPSG